MRLHVIGNGCPHPTPDWYGSAFILEVGRESVLIDCGPATTYKMTRMGLKPGQVGHVFLTHHHFDHNADFPCFALTRWDFSKGTEPPLAIYGPPPTKAFVEQLLGKQGAFFPDWQARVKHPASQKLHKGRGGRMPRPAPAFDARDVAPGPVARTKAWTATAERVHHCEPWLESLAYRFEADQGSVLFAGDCADCPELRHFAQGVHTLVAACAYVGRYDPVVADVITGAAEAGEIAQQAGARRLLLTHVSPAFTRASTRRRALAEAARAFSGEILLPKELTAVELVA